MPTSPALRDAARGLRQAPTRSEYTLWFGFLRARVPQWYRQRPVGVYVADFWCPSLRLVLEVDGAVHDSPRAQHRDDERTANLAAMGIAVLRVRNADVLARFDTTAAHLRCCIDARAAAVGHAPPSVRPRARNARSGGPHRPR